jgi:hypothetical protein
MVAANVVQVEEEVISILLGGMRVLEGALLK